MCLRTIAECTTVHACATHLPANETWDFAAIYYDAIDHFGHGFMKYHPPRQPFVSEDDFEIYKNIVAAGYVYHDLMLMRLLELAGPQTTVILVSDHGFHPDHLRPHGIPAEPAGPAVEHRDLGIFAMAGPGVRRDHLLSGATLLDVTPTILAAFGLPVGADMDGRPLVEAFEPAVDVRTVRSWDEVAGEDGRHAPGYRLDPEESRETLEQLVALGYIERPDDDKGQAVAKTRQELNYNLAMAYMDAGMHPKAAEILAVLYRESPLEFRFGIRLAICFQVMGMTQEMARVVEHLNTSWRRAAELARQRIREIAQMARDRRREAQEQEKQAVTDAVPKSARPSLFSDAEQRVIRQLRAIARGNERTLDYLAASIAMTKQETDAALGHLERARESATHTPGFHLQLGHAYLQLKRLEDATTSYERVLDLDPENPHAHLGLCRVALACRRNRDALASARSALGLKYHNPPAHYFLAICQHRLGAVTDAIGSLKIALAQNPNFPEAHDRLAMIYERRLGDRATAQEHKRCAREIQAERQSQLAARRMPELPPLEVVDLATHLPVMPEPPSANLKPPLGMAPLEPAASRGEPESFVTVVSGLPRSGTSMMMQMLAAGGVKLLVDEDRGPDDGNPHGYFELTRVKRLYRQNDWLDEARGRGIKVVAPLIPFLPQETPYRVVVMERDIDEIVASQGKMLDRMGRKGGRIDGSQLRRALSRQLEQAHAMLKAHGVPTLSVRYRDVLDDPEAAAARIAAFLGHELDQAAMRRAVDPTIYRERNGRSNAPRENIVKAGHTGQAAAP
jgi:tetratricopeptide (TPR) repeat protein